MSQITFDNISGWIALKGFAKYFLISGLFIGLITFICLYKVRKEIKKKNIKWIVIAILVVNLALLFMVFNVDVLYIIDSLTNNTEKTSIRVNNLYPYNKGYYTKKDNKRYNFGFNKDNIDNLQKYFISYKCEIQYYKLSGVVRSIKKLE